MTPKRSQPAARIRRGSRHRTRRGALAEAAAETYLLSRGYVVVARNGRWGGVELDRVAWDGPVLCVVEIRSRRHLRHGTPEESLDWKKRARLARGAGAFLQAHFRPPGPPARIDLVTVVGSPPDWKLSLYQNVVPDVGWQR